MTDKMQIPLRWHTMDPEQRIGFRGGRFTKANDVLAFLIGMVFTLVFFCVLIFVPRVPFADIFLERGPTQYPAVLLTFWSLAILWLKWRKLRFQRRALYYSVVPDAASFVISPVTADDVLRQLYNTADDPKQFVLYNRILVAISNLQNLGRVSDVDDILRSQAEQDEAAMESSYWLVEGFVWAIPVLGFIGTVIGLSEAIGRFSTVLSSGEDFSAITAGLRGVTAGLATAFDTTLVALVAALTIQLLLTFLRRAEGEFLEACSEYCTRHIVGRLRMLAHEEQE